MRVRLRGINSKRKKLADGSFKTYYWAWKGGPPLRGEPGSPEFIASYNDAIAKKVMLPRGTLLSLLQQYQASEDFRSLADSTRRSYIPLITRIEKALGDFPLSALNDRRTRGVFLAWRDKIAAASGRRQADYAWAVLARVLSWSLNRGLVASTPCERGGRLYRGGARTDKKSGPQPMKLRFWNAHPRICICRCYLLCGPGSDRVICFAFPGPVMTARISGYGRAKPEHGLSSALARRSKLRLMPH